MSIFRRGAKTAAQPETSSATDASESADSTEVADRSDESTVPETATEAVDGSAAVASSPVPTDRSAGPFDRSEVDDASGRLDLGSLWIGGLPGMEIRLEVDETAQQVVAANAVMGDSAVHLQAFAAPRSEGVWDDIRTEIASSITRQGGTAEVVQGPLGNELRAQMPAQGPGGRTVFSPARFVGVDGPRWFLRAVISGRAAADPVAAEPLLQIVRQTVVIRGDEAMAPRDLLPLQLPQEMSDAIAAEAEAAELEGPPTAGSIDDLNPFERGPEITEIR